MPNFINLNNRKMSNAEARSVEISKVEPKRLRLVGHNIKVYSAPAGVMLDTSRYAHVSRGNGLFHVVVDVGGLFVDRGMLDSNVPENELWSGYEHGHVTNLQQSPDAGVRGTVNKILTDHILSVNATDSTYYLNPHEIARFQQNLRQVVGLQKETEALATGLNGNVVPVAIARAGIPMTEMLGIGQDMLTVDAKRLNIIENHGGIAIGLRLPNGMNSEMLKTLLENESIVLADPALATFSTHLAFLSFCLINRININGFNCLAMTAAQAGLQLGNEVLDEIGIDNSHIVTAGIFPRLTGGKHPYYIQTADKKYAAGDAGDFSDLLLRSGDGYRKVWPDFFDEEQIKILSQRFPNIPKY